MAKKKNNNITFDDIKRIGPVKFVLLVIVAAILYFTGIDPSSIFNNGGNVNETPVPTSTTSNTVDASGIVQGIVARVIDGDTAVIRVNGEDRRVRFLGVDTPETVHPTKGVQPYGKEASNFTKESLTGRNVWLEYDKNPTDRYNRHLAYIWLSKPAQINDETIRRNMYNAILLAGGYAKVTIIKPNNRYEKLFKEIESEAKKSKLGMWQ
ncbi:MAG: thermonuclease family protein [Synergistaceae bacterium]|nr:thermonuclease family protein [Synergistaceae bacterium]